MAQIELSEDQNTGKSLLVMALLLFVFIEIIGFVTLGGSHGFVGLCVKGVLVLATVQRRSWARWCLVALFGVNVLVSLSLLLNTGVLLTALLIPFYLWLTYILSFSTSIGNYLAIPVETKIIASTPIVSMSNTRVDYPSNSEGVFGAAFWLGSIFIAGAAVRLLVG